MDIMMGADFFFSFLGSLNIFIKLFLAFFVLICLLLIFSGIFYRINVTTASATYRKVVIAYKFFIGTCQEAHQYLDDLKVLAPQLTRIVIMYRGIEYKKDSIKRETYAVGMVICVDGKYVVPKSVEILQLYGFHFAEMPGVNNAVFSTFPHRNYLSVFLSNYRVVPRIQAFIKELRLCAYPIVEFISDDGIQYIVPMAQQHDFFVPEARQFYRFFGCEKEEVSTEPPAYVLKIISRSKSSPLELPTTPITFSSRNSV